MANRMFKIIIVTILTLGTLPFLFSCKGKVSSEKESRSGTFRQVSAKEAKGIMETESNYVILDVRSQEEYDAGHIENATVIPHTEISARASTELPDKSQLILVYCRSGSRSKIAARTLAGMGYTNIVEFGGVIDWPFGTVKG